MEIKSGINVIKTTSSPEKQLPNTPFDGDLKTEMGSTSGYTRQNNAPCAQASGPEKLDAQRNRRFLLEKHHHTDPVVSLVCFNKVLYEHTSGFHPHLEEFSKTDLKFNVKLLTVKTKVHFDFLFNTFKMDS